MKQLLAEHNTGIRELMLTGFPDAVERINMLWGVMLVE
jgi:hypothetical protein